MATLDGVSMAEHAFSANHPSHADTQQLIVWIVKDSERIQDYVDKGLPRKSGVLQHDDPLVPPGDGHL